MPLDPDHDPAEDTADRPGDQPDTAASPAAGEGTRGQAFARVGTEDRLAAIYRQWRTSGRPTGDVLALVRTTSDAPDGLPFLDLLGVEASVIDDAWSAWDSAQVASDATPFGRARRPLVALVPAGGRWIAGRWVGHPCRLEPIDHPTPAQALSAAASRFELIAAGRIEDVDEAGVPVWAGAEEAGAPSAPTDPGEGADAANGDADEGDDAEAPR